MAEDAKGQKFSQRTGGLLDKVTGNQGTQQTQQTQQDTSGQQATGGIFLPGISNNQNLINSNKVSMNNGFTQGIQDGTIKSNIVLPGITSKPTTETTLDETTMKQKRQSYIYAKNNNIDTNSINEQIEEERTGSNKVLGQTGKILKTYRETPVNNIKKWGVRAIADSGLPGYFVDKTLEKAGAPDGIGDNIKDAVNETARKVAITYQNKVNEDFQEKVNKNIDPKIREKYDNESITDLIGKGDGAGARYKIWKGTVENWNMIPEIGLMFVNPYIGLATMGTDVYIQENQGTFEDMLQNGATYEQARDGAVVVGILNAGIELFMERVLGGAKRAGATALRRLFLKNAQKEVVRQATKKGMAEIFSKGVGEWLRGSMVEGFEEVLQQIVGNIMVKMVNPDRDITEGARESFEGGFYNLFNAIGGATNIANEFKQNEEIQKNADIEALKYVMEGEQRKAQRMAKEQARAKFLERVKNPTMDNGYTPSKEQAEQRAREKEENEQYEEELRLKQNEEVSIENSMIDDVLNDEEDSRYQKKEISATDESEDSSSLADQSPTGRVRISPENSSEITKSLNEIKNNLEDLKADTFLQQIKKSISGNEKNSNYVVNKINGMNYVLRVSDHHANSYQFDNSKQRKRNTSIVIKLAQKSKFKKNKNVDLAEFVYDPANMTTEKMQGIIDGIQNWIKTGEYTDTNYDSKNQSTRKRGDTKYQLKYEEKGYTPGVANKKEKDISGKEGIKQKNTINDETIEQLARKYGVKVEVIKGMIEILRKGKREGYAYGKYRDQLLTLSEQIKESTAPHELLHAIFDMIDPETKAYLIAQVMKSEGWSASKAEERLADSFSNFFRTGKIEGAPKSTWGKIKIFFKRVRSFINGMNRWRNELEEIFTDIITADGIVDLQSKIDESNSLNEAKEKMRKRFMEYRKNVIKMQKKAESENKYQRGYHGSPVEFNNFDHSHMGEGEGHQVHGWGTYIAKDINTGKYYAEMRDNRYTYDPKKFEKLSREEKSIIDNLIKDLADNGGKLEEYIKGAIKGYEAQMERENDGYFKDDIQKKIDFLKGIDLKDFTYQGGERNLYEVEFPDPVKADTPTGSNYLEEDGKMTFEQFGEILKELGKKNNIAMKSAIEEFNKSEAFLLDGRNVYNLLSKVLGGQKEASKFLESLGYDGIHYFGVIDGDAYVIFDENKEEIVRHEKYQKAEDIDPNIQSPNEMVHDWGGLMVMDMFISEEQKKRAYDVSKDILVHDGGKWDGHPYMWMHTNKYSSKMIPNFENTKDNRYKEFSDKGIVVSFFTNNDDMSKSYADQRSVLANTKKFKSIEEFNKMFRDDSNWTTSEISGDPVKTIFETKIVKDGDEYVIHKINEDLHKYTSIDDMYKKFMPRDRKEGLSDSEKIQAVKKYAKDNFMGEDFSLYDGIDINKDGKDIVVRLRSDNELGRYKTEKGALANARSLVNKEGQYHYKGIIQNMHNPLVVDEKIYGNTIPYWNDLGNAYDFLKKQDEDQLNKLIEYIDYVQDLEKKRTEDRSKLNDKIDKYKKIIDKEVSDARTDLFVAKQEGNQERIKEADQKEMEVWNKRQAYLDLINIKEDLLYRDPDANETNKIDSILKKHPDFKVLVNAFDKYGKKYYKLLHNELTRLEGFIRVAKEEYGISEATTSLLHGIGLYDLSGEQVLKSKSLQTNDFVFYALRKGGYDGVIFGRINDYGGKAIRGRIGGNVLVTFKPNQFKSWDNVDPTDSEFISYQRAESNQKDSDGKMLSNGQAEYFKDSKVRDKDGNLLVVYHGTQAGDFTVYMHGKNGMSNSLAKVGYRFTPNKQGALNFAKESWRGDSKPRADKVYLNITNPKIYEPSKINLMSEEERKVELDKQWSIYEKKKQKADAIDYTKAYGFFHDEYDHPIEERHLFATLSSQYEYAEKYNGKLGKYDPESMRWYSDKYGLDHDKIVKDVEEYERLKEEADKEYEKYLEMKINDPYDDFMYDIYKIDSTMDTKWTKKDLNMALNSYESPNKFREKLISEGYDGIIIKQTEYDGSVIGGGARNDQYVAFYSNQIKRTTNKNPTDNEDVRYQRVYHGSQADFDKFDSSHMGEGEGAQAHGWGHYVAVNPKTGRHYAELNHYDNEVEIKGKTITNPEDLWDVRYYVRGLYRDIFQYFAMGYNELNEEDLQNIIDRHKADLETTIEWYEKLIKDPGKPIIGVDDTVFNDALTADRKKAVENYKQALEELDDLTIDDVKVRPTSKKRHLYEVEIPDPAVADTPTGWNYLEEKDKPNKYILNRFIKLAEDRGLKEPYGTEDLIKQEGGLKQALEYEMNHHTTDSFGEVYNVLADYLGGKDNNKDKEASKFLESLGYKGIHYYGGRDGEAYVIFNDDDLEITNHERYQIAEYDYDDNGNRKWLKFGDNSEFDPSIFGTPTKEEQIEEDKENEKSSPFYNAWVRYNNQNYKDDQLTLEEFINEISKRGDKEQEIYDQKMRDIGEAQNDPKMLDLQLRAVKLMEEEGQVGKKFGKNVSKEVRDRQQAEVERKREQLVKDIFDWMYPGLRFEDATYDDQKMADQKEAEWEMLGREDIESKLKYFKKDKNGNREAKDIKVENPDIKLDKLLSSGKFDEIFEPVDRVLKWETPQGQHGTLDSIKDPKKFKSVMEKINSGKTKTKVELKDVTQEARAYEKQKAMEEAEKERKKKERDEAYAKKKQEEYKRLVRMKAFQRLVDMQRFEKYPFLTEEEIKNRYGFSDEEWKTITEQEEIKLPKKRGDRAISDFNKAVDDQVKYLIEGLNWQNNMKMREAEKNLGEIGEIDVDILLGRDEEKGQKEVEEFEKIAKEEKKKSKKEKNKRLEQAREDVAKVEIDTERENSKSEKERVDKLIKSTKTDKTVRGSVKQFTSDILTPVSTKIRNISKKIYMEVMRYFQNKDILTNQRLKEVDPFLKAMGKIRKENPVRFMDIWVALANRNIEYANGLLQEYGVKVPTKLLDTIYDEAEDVGLNINYLGSYYPLSVKAPKSFLEELMKINKGDIASQIEERIRKESQKKGGPLEESEITAIINEVIAGEDKGPDVNTGNKHLKKRNTEIKWTPKMLEYCDDPISTLISYIEGMTQSIERAKFLGKSRSGNVHTLADYVYNAKNGLDPEQQDELMDLLKAVFNDESPNKFVQTWRDLGTLTTLGSPSSTLTQIGDLSFSVYENGWRETLKAVRDIFASRKAFNLVDMGVLNRGEEYTNINSQKNLLQKAIHNVFKLTFFSQFDTFGKSAFIQSTWNKRKKRAMKGENGDPQLRKDIMKITNDEYMTEKIINDLRKGVFSEDVALVMYIKLGNIQPLTKAQMPKAYLNNPNGRLFYQFKTFGIKQLDYVLQETKEQTKNFKNLSTTDKMLKIAQIANMVFIMTLLGVGADELKDLTMRRRRNSLILRWLMGEKVGSEQIWEKMQDNVLKLFGLSRYTIMQMKNDPIDAITSLFTTLPATNLVNYPFKDIYKAFKDDGSINWRNPSSYQLIPVIGKYRYWIYGGGQDKQQEALDKGKKKSTKNKSTGSTRKPLSR